MRRELSPLALALILAAPGAALAEGEEDAPRLSLEELVARAVEHPRVRAETHAIRAARARAGEARGARFPRLEVNAFGGPSPDIDCENPTCTETSPRDVTVALDGVAGGVSAELAQPLYTFGKLSAAQRAARSAAEAATFTRESVRGDMATRAARAYYGLKLARDLIFMLEGGIEQIEKAQDRLEEALAEGEGGVTVQDRLRLRTLRAEIESRLAEAREAEGVALAAVQTLAGDRRADIDEAPLAPVEFELAEEADGYVEEGRQNRPELDAARAQVEAVGALAEVERARWLPDFLLLGGFDFAFAQGADEPPSAYAHDPLNRLGARVGLVARWQLNPVTHASRVRRSEEEARQAESLLEAAESAATLDIRRVYTRAAQARARLERSADGEKAARGWVASVLQAEAIGTAEPKELADAYVSYFQMRARVLESIHDWNLATVELRRALGEYPPAEAGPSGE